MTLLDTNYEMPICVIKFVRIWFSGKILNFLRIQNYFGEL